MKRRPGTGGEASAVRRLAAEAARAPVPEPDWARIEARLMARASEPPQLPLHGPSRGLRLAGGGLALAAAAALAVVVGQELRERAVPSGGSAAAPSSFVPPHAGDAFEATTEPRAIDWPGQFHCVLAPGTRVRVASVVPPPAEGGPASVTLALDTGAVEAEVVPQPRAETFAIEVERTRVAVHGTAFRVTREGSRARVQVFHGTVAVGEPGRTAHDASWLLTGPDEGTFSLDGAREAQWAPGSPHAAAAARGAGGADLGRAEPGAAPGAAATPPAAASEPGARPSPAAPAMRLPAVLGRQEAADGLERIRAELVACHERQWRAGQVRVSIDSSLALTVAPDGSVRRASFDPPLSPALMRCASEAVAAARFPRAEGPTQLVLPVHLGE